MSRVLLASIGGSPESIVHILKKESPEKVIFFTSHESRTLVEPTIIQHSGYFPMCGYIVTPDPEDVGICTFELLQKVPEEMRKLGEDTAWPEFCAYTGGTKAMSAAVVWASSNYPCELIYVGGNERTKNGLGIVKTGSEKTIYIHNPWDRTAWHQTELARNFFNQAQYSNSSKILEDGLGRVSNPDVRAVLIWMKNVSDFFHDWDVFDLKKAKKRIGSIRSISGMNFSPVHPQFPGIKEFHEQVENCIPFLENLNPGKPDIAMVHDLIANAGRRGYLEGKYEDAAARCYSAAEKLAKVRLKTQYNIDNSDVALIQIPENLRLEYSRYTESQELLRFGLKASYRLLEALGDNLGILFMEKEEEYSNLLGSRNASILGHGFSPVKEDTFRKIYKMVLELSGIEEKKLVHFPLFSVKK